MSLLHENRPSFSGHETFPLRHGWLEKAYHAVANNEKNPFLEESAISEFGVGKNMVNAIKYWSLATGFLEAENDRIRVSPYSRALIENERDPFIENLDTVWKIHYELVKNPKNTSVHWLFSYFNENVFDRNLVASRMTDYLKLHNLKEPAEKTLLNDINVTLANYCPSNSLTRREDDIGSPLCELKLIRRGEDNRFVFNLGSKRSLSQELFLECLVNFWEHEAERLDQNINSFKLEDLLHDPLTPGRLFLLSEKELAERLESVEEVSDGALMWSETAGISEIRKTNHYDHQELSQKWLAKS
jgi:hypothetical protein